MDPALEYLKQHLTAAQWEEFLQLAGKNPTQWNIPLMPNKNKLYISEVQLKAQHEALDALFGSAPNQSFDPVEYQRQMRIAREYL